MVVFIWIKIHRLKSESKTFTRVLYQNYIFCTETRNNDEMKGVFQSVQIVDRAIIYFYIDSFERAWKLIVLLAKVIGFRNRLGFHPIIRRLSQFYHFFFFPSFLPFLFFFGAKSSHHFLHDIFINIETVLFDRFDEYSNVRGNMTVLILVPARSSFINDFKTVTLDFVKNIEAKKKKKKIQAPSSV